MSEQIKTYTYLVKLTGAHFNNEGCCDSFSYGTNGAN